jgi:hypothetical protein
MNSENYTSVADSEHMKEQSKHSARAHTHVSRKHSDAARTSKIKIKKESHFCRLCMDDRAFK